MTLLFAKHVQHGFQEAERSSSRGGDLKRYEAVAAADTATKTKTSHPMSSLTYQCISFTDFICKIISTGQQ